MTFPVFAIECLPTIITVIYAHSFSPLLLFLQASGLWSASSVFGVLRSFFGIFRFFSHHQRSRLLYWHVDVQESPFESVATYGATLNRRSYGAEPFFLSPRCAGPVACDSIKESRKDLIISARSFVTFVFSRLFLLDIIHLIPPWI
jgi:hypothetical protein